MWMKLCTVEILLGFLWLFLQTNIHTWYIYTCQTCMHMHYAFTDNTITIKASGGCSSSLLILWVQISSDLTDKSMFLFHYFFSLLFLQLFFFFSFSLNFLQCLSPTKIEIDNLYIVARVSGTDKHSGGLISFLLPGGATEIKPADVYKHAYTRIDTNRCSLLYYK